MIKGSTFLFSSSSSLAYSRRHSNAPSSRELNGYFGAARAKALMTHGAMRTDGVKDGKGKGVERRDDVAALEAVRK